MIPRYYYPHPLSTGQNVTISEALAHCLLRVHRKQVDDKIILFNGLGGYFDALITQQERHTVTVLIQDQHFVDVESPLNLWLGQSLVSNDKMDWCIQKAVELGVSRISPVLAQRSVNQPQPNKSELKRLHWQGIVVASAEQCHRNILPVLDPIRSPSEWFTQLPAESIRLMLIPGGLPLPQEILSTVPIVLWIGPEGGWSAQELQWGQDQGFQSWGLGPRILRTETAGLVALSVLQNRWGDLAPSLPEKYYNTVA